jgi:hypothetical protein
MLARCLAALLAATGLLLGACGDDKKGAGSPAKTTAAVNAPAATGAALSGTGYRLNLASGWRDATKQASQSAFRFDVVIVKPRKRFSTNVNIIRVKAPREVAPKDLRDTYRGELDSIGATGVTDSTPFAVDGDDGITYQYDKKAPTGDQLRGRQVLVVHGGYVHTITLTATDSQFEAANKQFDSMLSSWHWT